jgi:hypothetical protein
MPLEVKFQKGLVQDVPETGEARDRMNIPMEQRRSLSELQKHECRWIHSGVNVPSRPQPTSLVQWGTVTGRSPQG